MGILVAIAFIQGADPSGQLARRWVDRRTAGIAGAIIAAAVTPI
jgi:hypothetical protein